MPRLGWAQPRNLLRDIKQNTCIRDDKLGLFHSHGALYSLNMTRVEAQRIGWIRVALTALGAGVFFGLFALVAWGWERVPVWAIGALIIFGLGDLLQQIVARSIGKSRG